MQHCTVYCNLTILIIQPFPDIVTRPGVTRHPQHSSLSRSLKGTLSPHKKISYMKHMDPLSTKNPSKNTSEFFNPPKKALKVQFSVLNRAENVSMAPLSYPQMRQWLQNFIPIGVNGSRFSSLSASMTPYSFPRIR